ncbi:MAG TPA: YIP1 family protein [Ignavibacteriaceae bacterium]|nr:YIP1 family protein [Ignavibacteriaceae bacterium]
MKRILAEYLDDNFNKDFTWRTSVLFFSFYGTFASYYLSNEAILTLHGITIVKILTTLTVGFLFGNLTTFPFAFIVKLIGNIFHIRTSYKDIVKTLTIAYKPHLITSLLIICRIIIAPDSKIQLAADSIGLLLVFSLILNLLISLFGIASLILLFQGLMKVQNLPLRKTILYFLIASIAFSPVYLLLTKI